MRCSTICRARLGAGCRLCFCRRLTTKSGRPSKLRFALSCSVTRCGAWSAGPAGGSRATPCMRLSRRVASRHSAAANPLTIFPRERLGLFSPTNLLGCLLMCPGREIPFLCCAGASAILEITGGSWRSARRLPAAATRDRLKCCWRAATGGISLCRVRIAITGIFSKLKISVSSKTRMVWWWTLILNAPRAMAARRSGISGRWCRPGSGGQRRSRSMRM